MKEHSLNIIFFLVFLALFLQNGNCQAQENPDIRLSINASGQKLHLVLDNIAKKSGYYFTFDSRLGDSQKNIRMELEDVSIQEAIDTLFDTKGLTYKLINKNIVIYLDREPVGEEAASEMSKTSKHEVSGIIREQRTGKVLPFASVVLYETYSGTLANEEGRFVLHIPDSIIRPTLVTSYIGYKNQYTPISVDSDSAIEIRMHKNVISLQEVIIRRKDPLNLLRESIDRIDENYMNEAAGMMAYYREKIKKEEKCMIYSEAVMEIAKPSYNHKLSQERSHLLKGRRITNVDEQDTVIMKIRSGIKTLLGLDIIKYPPDFLSPELLSDYNLTFSDVVSFKDQLVYVLSFTQKEEIKDLLFRGDLYIDRESLAIIAADFEYDPLKVRNHSDMFVAKKSRGLKVVPLSAKYHVEYSQADGKYYLSQALGEVRFKIRKRREWIASRYQINLELAITSISPGNPPDIKLNEQIKASSILADENFQYDPDFWGDYNTITPEAGLREVLNNLSQSLIEISSGGILEEE